MPYHRGIKYQKKQDGTIVIIGCAKFMKHLKIPSEIKGLPVTEIAAFAFHRNYRIESVIIPDGVACIGALAFLGCRSLRNITISDDIKNIQQGVFCDTAYYNNENNWKDGVLYVGRHAVDTHSDIVSANCEIKEGTLTIADYTFANCPSLKEIKISSSVKHIGKHISFNCILLKKITVSEDNKNYSSENGVLFSKDKTELIEYPAGKENNIYKVPDSVSTIRDFAFFHCDSLETIILSINTQNMCRQTFCDCHSLTKIIIPDGVASLLCHPFSCFSLKTVVIPNSVTTIGPDVFTDFPDIAIKCNADSYAERYAQEKNISTEIITSNLDRILEDAAIDANLSTRSNT